MHIAIITAKGGNQSLANKNVIPIYGKPSMVWSIDAAKQSKYINEIFVSTECPLITSIAQSNHVRVIQRPEELSQPFTNHGDVIKHAYYAAKEILKCEITTLTILLGNTVMTTSVDIDNTIEKV